MSFKTNIPFKNNENWLRPGWAFFTESHVLIDSHWSMLVWESLISYYSNSPQMGRVWYVLYVPDCSFMHVTVCCGFLISFVMGGWGAVRYCFFTALEGGGAVRLSNITTLLPPSPLQCGGAESEGENERGLSRKQRGLNRRGGWGGGETGGGESKGAESEGADCSPPLTIGRIYRPSFRALEGWYGPWNLPKDSLSSHLWALVHKTTYAPMMSTTLWAHALSSPPPPAFVKTCCSQNGASF